MCFLLMINKDNLRIKVFAGMTDTDKTAMRKNIMSKHFSLQATFHLSFIQQLIFCKSNLLWKFVLN